MYSSTVACFATHHRRLEHFGLQPLDHAVADRKPVTPARRLQEDRRLARPDRLDDLPDDVDALDVDHEIGGRLVAGGANPPADLLTTAERLSAKRLAVDSMFGE